MRRPDQAQPMSSPSPLHRFAEIYRAVMSQRRWYEGAMPLRYAAMILTSTDGPPADVAARLVETAKTLRDNTGWFGSLRGMLGTVLAADLVRRGRTGREFQAWVDEVTAALRDQGLPRSGMFAATAALILDQGLDRRLDPAVLRRMRAHYDEMKSNHRWLTGSDDLPACAMLALRDEPVTALARRCEAIYDGLRGGGIGRGNAQQLASHLMAVGDADAVVLVRRFLALHRGFKEAGVAMWVSDYDELACLSLIDARADKVIRTVLEHRAVIAQLRPQPDRSASFSLASATAFLEFAGDPDSTGRASALSAAQHAALAQQMAQQAAAAAAMSACIAASTAAAAASSG